MSRATSTDPTWGSTLALAFSQAAANCLSPAMVAACWLGVAGAGSDRAPPVAGPQVTGSLRSTPRGSNRTMSKSSSSGCVREVSSLAMSSIPDTPGPPGSMTSDPMRVAGSSAGWRATAMGMVGPAGCA